MLALLTGPEPWVAFGLDPDDEDETGGTIRDDMLARREGLPPILWTKVTKRTVTQTEWVEFEHEEDNQQHHANG